MTILTCSGAAELDSHVNRSVEPAMRSQLLALKGWRGFNNPWMAEADDGEEYLYINLRVNPERYTGGCGYGRGVVTDWMVPCKDGGLEAANLYCAMKCLDTIQLASSGIRQLVPDSRHMYVKQILAVLILFNNSELAQRLHW